MRRIGIGYQDFADAACPAEGNCKGADTEIRFCIAGEES